MSRHLVRKWLFLESAHRPTPLIGCVAQILPALHKYIELRRRLAGSTGDLLQPSEDTSPPTTGFTQPSGKGKAETSKDMAQQIALLTEEILRASQEKVNIAQTNCDSVFVLI